jgi:hypothetical protein
MADVGAVVACAPLVKYVAAGPTVGTAVIAAPLVKYSDTARAV